jgi:FkbM family methyltransferase
VKADILPDWWEYRPETWDWNIFLSVVTHNEYRLPDRFEEEDVIVDIGAHIGSFAYAAYVRGARLIYAYEAEPNNAAILRHNAERLGVRVVNAAVWRSDTKHNEPISYMASTNHVNTGGGGIILGDSGLRVARVRFDDCVNEATNNGKKRIKCLKLDCEGSEFPILATSKKLSLVDSICGEYHESAHPTADNLPRTWSNLASILSANGFAAHREVVNECLGHFWATRTSVALPKAQAQPGVRGWQQIVSRLRRAFVKKLTNPA